jgi:hypothetical protein
MPYTPPTGQYESTEVNQTAYNAAHEAGWTHANYAAAYPGNPDAQERLTDVAQRWATERGHVPRSRPWLRAVEGFTDGHATFSDVDDD